MNQVFADAQAAFPFVIAQGRTLEQKIYARKYPRLNYARVVPVVTEGNEWGIGTTFFTVDTAGEAKILSGTGTDMPFNRTTHDQASKDYFMIGSGWEWTMEEINQAGLYGINLSGTEAAGADDKVERLLNTIAFLGTTEKNLTGFANDAGIAVQNAGQTAANGTPAQNYALVNNALNAVSVNSLEIEMADTLAVPPAVFRAWNQQSSGQGDGTLNVLSYIRANNSYTGETGLPLDIIPVRELATAAANGTSGRMVAYRKDEEVVRFHLPMPKKVLQPRQKSIMGFETGIIARTGGTEWRLPGAAVYVDGVS